MYLILLFKNMLTIEHQIDFGRKRQKVDDETPPLQPQKGIKKRQK